MQTPASLERRYAAKLTTNLLGAVIALMTLGIAPRVLGPAAFGRFEFLSSFFSQVMAFLDTGTSSCYYTRLSQRPWDRGLLMFYGVFTVAAAVVVIAAAAVVAHHPLGERVWPEEPVGTVLLAALLATSLWWMQIARKTVDAYGMTVSGEKLVLAQKALFAAALAATATAGLLDLQGYFALQIAAALLGVCLCLGLVWRTGLPAQPPGRAVSAAPAYAREFWHYSHPLLIYSAVGVVAGLLDRWVLQAYAGPTEQGFFGLAYQIGALCFLFTAAMTPLIAREFAIAWAEADMDRMRATFGRYVPLFYAMAAYFAVFIALRSADVVRLFGGEAFVGGAATVALMALYPMHQTYGQLSGAVFLAADRTRQYRNIGVVGILCGVPVLWVLVAPAENGGLGLGAWGLAVKAVAMQAVLVNVQLWFNARLLGMDFGRMLRHQFAAPAAFAACGLLASAGAGALAAPWLTEFLLAGVMYTLLVAGTCRLFPALLGLRREEFAQLVGRLKIR